MGGVYYILRWRNYIWLCEIVWLRDYCVDGKVVFFVVGYCCMVIEVVVRFGDCRNESIVVVYLKEVLIKVLFILREDYDEGVEMVLELRFVVELVRMFLEEWFEFEVLSFEEGLEMRYCYGRIWVEYGELRGLRLLIKVEGVEEM